MQPSVTPSTRSSRAALAAVPPTDDRAGDAALLARIEALDHEILSRSLPETQALACQARAGPLVDHLAELAAAVEVRRRRAHLLFLPMLRRRTPACLDLASRRLMSDHVDVEVRLLRLRRLAPGSQDPRLEAACSRLEAGLRDLMRLEDALIFESLLS